MKTSIRLLVIALFIAAVIGSETHGANFRVPAEDGWYTWQVEATDGSELQLIGSDDHEQLDILPAQVKVIRHKRLKYACPCCGQHMVTAKKSKQPIEKSIASPGLLAFVATQKYCDALPLYRQSERSPPSSSPRRGSGRRPVRRRWRAPHAR